MFSFGGNGKKEFSISDVLIIIIIIIIIYYTCLGYRCHNNRLEGGGCVSVTSTQNKKYAGKVSSGTSPDIKDGFYGEQGTMLEKHRKVLKPEKKIMREHMCGDELHNTVNKMDDPLTLDGLLQKSDETSEHKVYRDLKTASRDGPQLEGMSAPITDFENDALSRQLVKHQEIYGGQVFQNSDADIISMLNI
jgi:hypothetical protein